MLHSIYYQVGLLRVDVVACRNFVEAAFGPPLGNITHHLFVEVVALSESQQLGSPGEIVIVIEPAGFKEMAWLHMATYGLSPREEEVVGFVVRGASTRQISQALYVTEDTVQKHIQNAFEKVGVRSRQALVKRLYLNTIFP